MKYFIIEGSIKNPELMNEKIMQEHIAYSKKAMSEGFILMSGLKADMSGGLLIMKAESLEKLEEYLAAEPLKLANIQGYHIIEFSPHYLNPLPNEWGKH